MQGGQETIVPSASFAAYLTGMCKHACRLLGLVSGSIRPPAPSATTDEVHWRCDTQVHPHDRARLKMNGMDVWIALQNGTPSIHVDLHGCQRIRV